MTPGYPKIRLAGAGAPEASLARVERRELARHGFLRVLAPAISVLCGGLAGAGEAPARAADHAPGAAILQQLRSFNTTGTLLHVAAHPDDENTQLITYFARGRGYRTAYLSVTRGDGGQNEIGPEFDEKLGVARTQELLAARRLDGGRQFFTRAIDFGYSKSVDETLAFWGRQEVLGDVVRVIRKFRPDVIVTRSSPTPSGTHAHHTTAALLAVEAFKRAGDPKAYPEQLTQGLSPWQAKRVLLNGFGGGRGGSGGARAATPVRVDTGGNDPVTGESFREIAMRSRRMHITQGFGSAGMRGTGEESFVLLGGEPAEKDVMDGIDTTWSRFAGGAEIGRMTEEAIAQFKTDAPSASVPALLAIRAKLAVLPRDPVIDDRRAQFDRIVQSCLGLTVSTTAGRPEVVPGESLNARVTIDLGGDIPVKWVETRNWEQSGTPGAGVIERGRTASREFAWRVAADMPPTQPYWLREEPAAGRARVSDPAMIGLPENPPALAVEHVFEVGGQTLVVPDEVVHAAGPNRASRARRVDVIPPVSLRFASGVSLIAPGSKRVMEVVVTAARDRAEGVLQLQLPPGWDAAPAGQRFHLSKAGDIARLTFSITAPAKPTSGRVVAHAEVGGRRYSNQRIEIDYPHLPFILLQPTARATLASFAVGTRGRRVGYLPGAGDATAEALEQLGYAVTRLTGADLAAEKLRGLDAVVIGVRAFNERKDLAAGLPALFAYVENGGTVIAQYNRPNGLQAQTLGPYPLSIQGSAPDLRVTNEAAPVTFLAPEHPALTTPNPIGPADFAGWVQERGAYFPSKWDPGHYVPLLAMSDPGEAPLKSSVLVAKHGRGYYVYSGLAFFRQLPAGVPGAYRLFANLVSLGK